MVSVSARPVIHLLVESLCSGGKRSGFKSWALPLPVLVPVLLSELQLPRGTIRSSEWPNSSQVGVPRDC